MVDIPAGLNTTAHVQLVSTLGTFSGTIEKAGDHDWIAFNAVSGQTYQIFLCLANPGTADGDADFIIHDAQRVQRSRLRCRSTMPASAETLLPNLPRPRPGRFTSTSKSTVTTLAATTAWRWSTFRRGSQIGN